MKRARKPSRRRAGVIPLNDLTPKRDPRGGAGMPAKIVFGERPIPGGGDEDDAGGRGATGNGQRRDKEGK